MGGAAGAGGEGDGLVQGYALDLCMRDTHTHTHTHTQTHTYVHTYVYTLPSSRHAVGLYVVIAYTYARTHVLYIRTCWVSCSGLGTHAYVYILIIMAGNVLTHVWHLGTHNGMAY